MRFAVSDLVWVNTVCSGLSVRIRRVSMEIRSNRIPSEIILDPPLIKKKKKKMLGRLVKFIIKAYVISSL